MPPAVIQRLDQLLADVRRQARFALAARGVAWLVAVAVGLTLLAGLLDWAWHLDDVAWRLGLSAGILVCSVWVTVRYLVGPLRVRFTPVDLALRIESRYPVLGEALASSVDFLEHRVDQRMGSPALQHVVIRDTLTKLDRLTVDDVVDTRPVQKVVAVATGICVLAGTIFGLNQSAAAIALHRLVMPLSAPAWPRETQLRLLDNRLEPLVVDTANPRRIARGQTMRLFVENVAGVLPERVVFEHRVGAAGDVVRERMRPATARDPAGRDRELLAFDLSATRGPIEFRAVGGDDYTMAWLQLLVVSPPAVDQFQVMLTPPEYVRRLAEQTRRAGGVSPSVEDRGSHNQGANAPRSPAPFLFFETKRLPAGSGHVEALVGTRVQIEARSNRELKGAELHLRGDIPVTLDLADDGRSITGSFQVATSGLATYWIDLIDTDGVRSQDSPRYEVRGVADAVPEVVLEVPAADMVVTPDADVPLQVVATDDLNVKSFTLRFTISSGEQTREPSAVTLFERSGADGTGLVTRQVVKHNWSLPDLNLHDGDQVLFHIEAEDDYDLSPEPHVGTSAVRALRVVSAEQKRIELAQRQLSLLLELERAQRQQGDAQRQVRELQQQNDKVGTLRPQDADALQLSEMQQRQVDGKLADPRESIAARARELLDELRYNKLDDAETRQRLERLEGELSRLGREHVPPLEQGFTKARKQAQAASPESRKSNGETKPAKDRDPKTPTAKQLGESLSQIGEHQTAILESLGELLQSLSQWRDEQDIARELAELVADQAELQKQTGATGQRTLTKPLNELPPQEQADLARLAERERRLAQAFEQWQGKLEELQKRQASQNPAGAGALADAVEKSKRDPLAPRMRDAAGQVQNNRIGDAMQSQKQIADKLRELQDALRGEEASTTDDSVEALRKAERDLADVRQRQAELRNKSRKAAEETDPAERKQAEEQIREEQEKVREQAAELARRLQRQGAARGGEATRRAAERMKQAEKYLERDEPRVAEQIQQEALDDLEQAQRELAKQRRQLEEQQVRDQLAVLSQQIQNLATQQERIVADIHKIDEARTQRGSLTRTEQLALRDLAASQRQVRQQADRLAEQIAGVFVFAETLHSAGRGMNRVAELLDQKNTSGSAQQAAQSAHQKLVDLLAALKSAPVPKPSDMADESGGGEGAPMPDENERGEMRLEVVTIVPQLKLLKTWQQQVADRTETIHAALAKTPLTADQQHELDELDREQAALRDLVEKLIEFANSLGREGGGDDADKK
ncbi:MAG: hypothetical protein HZA46_07060 [Planctomycetales bacterium]|nr:hypothetical protein [Planctomycetales bacterium]